MGSVGSGLPASPYGLRRTGRLVASVFVLWTTTRQVVLTSRRGKQGCRQTLVEFSGEIFGCAFDGGADRLDSGDGAEYPAVASVAQHFGDLVRWITA